MFSKFKNVYMLYFVLFSNKRVACTYFTYFNTSYLLRFLNLEYNKSDKNHVVSQMAHAKNLYNISWWFM